jgi:heat shock protein HslJ
MFRPPHVAPFLAALAAATLALCCSTGQSLAQSAAAKPWVLQQGREIVPPRKQKPVLRMEGQRLSGSTGCNSFTAAVNDRPDKKVAIADVTLTRKLCGPQESQIEDALVRALSDTEYLKKERRRLTFLSGKQEVLLVWTRGGKTARKRSARRSLDYRARKARAVVAASWCRRR